MVVSGTGRQVSLILLLMCACTLNVFAAAKHKKKPTPAKQEQPAPPPTPAVVETPPAELTVEPKPRRPSQGHLSKQPANDCGEDLAPRRCTARSQDTDWSFHRSARQYEC